MAAGGPADPTMPVPSGGDRRGAPPPPEPTGTGALPGAYDPTMTVPAGGGPDEPGGPYGPGPYDGDGDNRKWLYGLLAALGVIILGIVIALLLSGDDGDQTAGRSTTTSSSSSSTSTSTSTSSSSTTTTSTASSPQITNFTASPSPVPCPNPATTVNITLSWSTSNALGVSVSIDGPGKYADYGANGSAQVPFACSGSHSYTLTANGSGGQSSQRTITVQPQLAPPTTLPPTTAPPVTTTTK